ncbi:MAG: methyltransferase family protein [bacterium]
MAAQSSTGGRGALGRAGEWLLKLVGLFVILEPIWMLLPFAGFLYGSVLHIKALNRNPSTAWLAHFVFPTLTLGWLGGAAISGLGLLLFCIGAAQIYAAKIRKSGLVTGGLYRFVRHPQYIALTLFGVGVLLTWGRAITFIAFFGMMFLYYYLAKSEERSCIRLFGEAYERYRQRTSFIIPGDRYLRPLAARLPRLGLPAWVRVPAAFAVTMLVCFGLMWLIQSAKAGLQTHPYIIATVPLRAEGQAEPGPTLAARVVGDVPYVEAGRVAVVRGPYRSAAATGFAERVARRLRKSESLEEFLAFLDEPEGDVAIVFCAPYARPETPGTPGMRAGGGPGGRGPGPDPSGPDRVRLIVLRCALAAGAAFADAFASPAKRTIRGACIAPVNLARPPDQDMVEGKLLRPGPGFPGEQRWAFFLRQLSRRREFAPRLSATAVSPGAAECTLVLVQAPIVKTRLFPSFARRLLDRLVASEAVRKRLRASGAGGDVVAVAFPRPGPNWYREHDADPQISFFIMLARLAEGADLDALFERGQRELLGAFTAEMDLATERPADAVTETGLIGPRRGLEERWRFFLSGLGR